MVLDMFKTFIRSPESGIPAVNKSSKCERCFIIIILLFRCEMPVACSPVFEDCSCISCWALCELLQYFLPNMIVGNIVKVGG